MYKLCATRDMDADACATTTLGRRATLLLLLLPPRVCVHVCMFKTRARIYILEIYTRVCDPAVQPVGGNSNSGP